MLGDSLGQVRDAYLSDMFEGMKAPACAVADLTLHVTKGESPGWQGFEYVQSGPMFITSEHVLWGSLCFTDCKRIPEAFHAKLERSAIQAGDVLINLVGASIGRAAIAPDGLGPANTNQAVAVVRFYDMLMLPEFFLAWYLSPATQKVIAATRVNTARANVSLTDIRNLKVPTPPIADQRQLVRQMNLIAASQRLVQKRVEAASQFRHRVLNDMAAI
jgi:type I restriction enzyme, S subunit